VFSLDVCHVLQFYREVLVEPISHNNSLIIFVYLCTYVYFGFGILIYFGNFWDMLENFGDPSSGFHQLIFDAARAISCAFQLEPVDPIKFKPLTL
jgi:hypothetical protein